MCGFNELERKEKIERAHQIINSTELKQAICHKILGTTFKDVEKIMNGIIKEKQLTSSQEEELELREEYPEKFEPFDPYVEFKANKKAADPVDSNGYGTYTRDQVAELFAAADKPIERQLVPNSVVYPTLTKEQCQILMAHHYEYEAKEKAKKAEKEELSKWDSQKTTELELKTVSKTKLTNSFRA